MVFTLDDYKKILEWLRRYSIKDSELPETLDIYGNEVITLVQNGQNVKISLKKLIEKLFTLNVLDFVNIPNKYDIQQAIISIPYKARKLGQVITFCNEDSIWKIYQFLGENLNQWNTLSCWVDILRQNPSSILSDEEDLTTIEENNTNVVKFKDKIYNPDTFSGRGRKYLRKNIVKLDNNSIINLLTLEMISKENTIYIILYDYNLNGLTITIPEGSILKFEGGKISNGTIALIDTIVETFNNDITNCIDATIAGTFAIGQCLFDTILKKPKWWNGSNWVDATGATV